MRQRFAPNQKTVVATDEFGFVPEGNIGEFMKFLPGVTVETNGGYARSISVDGVSADYVPVTVSGFTLASAFQGGGTTRQVSADNLSINNLARIEVSFSPTPDTQASALSGSVELSTAQRL
jgi:outer membrane cobalamin receptor